MAASGSKEVLRHTVIDRLSETGGRAVSGDLRIGVEDLKRTVLRDIQWLLNSKQSLMYQLRGFPEASNSILSYGLPDFSSLSASSGEDCGRICGLIADTLRRFEPRLEKRSIKVEFVEDDKVAGLQARFRIRGVLHVDPVREPVSFDTHIEMDTGTIEVTATD